VLGAYYVYLKRGSLRLAPVAFLVVYVISVSFFNLPNLYLELCHLASAQIASYEDLLAEPELLGPSGNRFPYLIALADLLLAAALALAWWTRAGGRRRGAFRPAGVVTASLLGGVALIGAVHGGVRFSYFENEGAAAHPANVLRWVAVFASVFSAGLLHDGLREEPSRPQAPVLAALFLFSICFAGLVGYATLTLSLTLMGLILLARTPPWRLGDRGPLSAVLLAGVATTAFVLGFSLFARDFAALAISRGALMSVLGVAFVFLAAGGALGAGGSRRRWLLREAAPLLMLAVAAAALVRHPIAQAPGGGTPRMLDHFHRGKIFLRNREHQHALIEYRRSMALGLRDPDAYRDLVEIYGVLGLVQEVPAAVAEARERGATSEDLYLDAGNAFMQRGDHERAASILEDGTAAHPRSHMLANNRALCYAALGRSDEAVDWYRKAIELDPHDPATRQNLALLYYKLDRYEESEREFRGVVEIVPDHLPALKSLTFLWVEKLTDPERAREFGRRYLEAGPPEAEARLVREKLAALPE
jgi:tetratricopeptide (TPR) repeat protein